MKGSPKVRPATPLDAASIARVQVASWRSTYPGIVPEGFLSKMSVEEHEARWRAWLREPSEGRIFFVAESCGGEVVGFASGGPPPEGSRPEYDGWLYTIYLLDEHRGRGTGGELFRAVAGGLAARGRRSLLLWVVEKNLPARRFYEALGGEVVGESSFEVEGESVGEVAYGWPDVGRFLRGDGTS